MSIMTDQSIKQSLLTGLHIENAFVHITALLEAATILWSTIGDVASEKTRILSNNNPIKGCLLYDLERIILGTVNLGRMWHHGKSTNSTSICLLIYSNNSAGSCSYIIINAIEIQTVLCNGGGANKFISETRKKSTAHT